MAIEKDTRYKQFDLIMGRYYRLIRLLCWRQSLGSDILCDELMQECSISIWSHLDSLRVDSHQLQQAAWVVWRCRDTFAQHRRRRRFRWQSIDDQMAESTAAADGTSHRELIEELAATLNNRERCLLALYLEGYTLKEIAAKIGISEEAAKKMKQRIVLKMADNAKDKKTDL